MRAYYENDDGSLFKLLYDLELNLDDWTKRTPDSGPQAEYQSCLLLEMLKGSDLAVELSRRWVGICGTEVVEVLRDPPRGACLQVFIWDIPEVELISPRLVDAFGLTLRISPQFFRALFLLVNRQHAKEEEHETELRPLRSDFVVMNNAVVFIGRNRPSERDSAPVVLIAGNLTPKFAGKMIPDTRMDSILDCVDQELWNARPSQVPAVEVIPCVEAKLCYAPVHGYAARDRGAARGTRTFTHAARKNSWVFSYSDLLNELLKRDSLRDMARDKLSFIALLPLMQLDILWIRQSCRWLRPILPNAGSEANVDVPRIHEYRQLLRRLVEDAEDSLDHLRTHITWQKKNE